MEPKCASGILYIFILLHSVQFPHHEIFHKCIKIRSLLTKYVLDTISFLPTFGNSAD